MVYYRKYRPQNISELDLKEVKEKLTTILSSKNIPHAFLFVGPRGLGKTSSARILAKALNCQSKKGIEPCNKCDICISITQGSNIDIIEIDAASNRGVDEIRSLREKVKFIPSELSKKVYIIDEVHMLTNEAFNALLKTLEEPPDHVVFVLATTESHKIPQTILSRVFEVKFEEPKLEEVRDSVIRIAAGENIKVAEGVYEKIYELSEGSFRDAAKIFEELVINSKDSIIDTESINKVFKSGSAGAQTEKLLESIYKKDMKASLLIIERIVKEGVDPRIIIEKMVQRIRNELVHGNSKLSISDLKKILELLNEAYSTTKISVVPQLPLELAVIEWSAKLEASDSPKKRELSEGKKEVKGHDDVQLSKSNDFLKELIEGIHPESRQVAAFLRSCKDAVVKDKTLILTTPYPLHAEKLSKKEFADLILKKASSLNPKIKDLSVETN